jgi:GrpB-like predicted nucleotidyltransferase (UPF0157 family)
MREPIRVVDYDSAWPVLFETLRQPLAEALGELTLAIEHVGSTAVPGLAAKPVIDLDVVLVNRDRLPAAITRLAALGYAHQGDLGIPGREAFDAPAGAPPHHLYVCAADSEELRRHLLLRDYLRAHPEAVLAYGTLKRSLADRYPYDRKAYTDGKSELITLLLARAEANGQC